MKAQLQQLLHRLGLLEPSRRHRATARAYRKTLRDAGRRRVVRSVLKELGYDLVKSAPAQPAKDEPPLRNREIKYPLGSWYQIPDSSLYTPFFSPWLGEGEFKHYYAFAAPRSLVSIDRCYVLYTLLMQSLLIPGDVWECGVYKGGTAAMMAALLRDKMPSKKLYLFDTFEGMPATDSAKDVHKKGDFADTSTEGIMTHIGCPDICEVRPGFIPSTFAGLESAQIAFAHVDVDIYQSVLDSLNFIWPRLSRGGFIIADDYGWPSCPGARAAVEEFFVGKSAIPLCLVSGQALIFKGAAW